MKSAGQGNRLRVYALTLVTLALALAVVVLVNHVAGWPGFRQRIDLTQDKRSTLSTATLGVIRKIEQPIEIDVFFRGEEQPLTAVALEAMGRVFTLLKLLDADGGERIEVVNHDPNDTDSIATRLRELQIRGFENCVVVSLGERRQVLRLKGDLARFDPGKPIQRGYVPATITAFQAEEEIVEAILEVTRGDSPQLYFSQGHGEPDLEGDSGPELALLKELLEKDGFSVAAWNFVEDGPVPDDCAALAILAPDAAFAEQELMSIRSYVDGGGRVVVAPHPGIVELERSSVTELLDGFGIEVSPGLVMQAFRNSLGVASAGLGSQTYLVPPAGMSVHPITDPLRDGGRVVRVSNAHWVKGVRQPESGTTREILRSYAQSWIDLPPIDYVPANDGVELVQSFELCVVSSFLPPDAPELVGPLEEKKEGRIVAVGSAEAFVNAALGHNADFLRNVFNWAAEREYRLSITPRDVTERRIPLGAAGAEGEATALEKVFRVVWGLPVLCMALGILTTVLRLRGNPRQRSA